MALREYHKVDLETGTIIDVLLYDSEVDTIPEDCKESWSGDKALFNPRWDFALNDWVEGREESDILKELRVEKILELKDICNEDIMLGFVAQNGHFYGFGIHDQMNFTHQKLEVEGDQSVSAVHWKTVDSGIVSHTREEFLVVCSDAKKHKEAMILKFWIKEQQINNATTREEIRSISWA